MSGLNSACFHLRGEKYQVLFIFSPNRWKKVENSLEFNFRMPGERFYNVHLKTGTCADGSATTPLHPSKSVFYLNFKNIVPDM
jgi:hypothetical protein